MQPSPGPSPLSMSNVETGSLPLFSEESVSTPSTPGQMRDSSASPLSSAIFSLRRERPFPFSSQRCDPGPSPLSISSQRHDPDSSLNAGDQRRVEGLPVCSGATSASTFSSQNPQRVACQQLQQGCIALT